MYLSSFPFLSFSINEKQTKDGTIYEGVLESVTANAANGDAKSTAATASSLQARLRIVSKVAAAAAAAGGDAAASSSAAPPAERPVDALTLDAGDLVSIDATDVRLGAEGYVSVGGPSGELGTDAEIGAGKGG